MSLPGGQLTEKPFFKRVEKKYIIVQYNLNLFADMAFRMLGAAHVNGSKSRVIDMSISQKGLYTDALNV